MNFTKMLLCCQEACNALNYENNLEHPGYPIQYEILQLSDYSNTNQCVYELAAFYNSFTGNEEFIHIPNFQTIYENCRNFPVIIARNKHTHELLGVSTLKYFENDSKTIDPYFPIENAKYFSITGLMAKKQALYHGAGKGISEVAIRATKMYREQFPEIRLMLVIDCRNYHSTYCLKAALRNIKRKDVYGLGTQLSASIIGYYELMDKETKHLIEAPTMVIEIGLQTKPTNNDIHKIELQFNKKPRQNLYLTILKDLKRQLQQYQLYQKTVLEDPDWGIVRFTSLLQHKECHIERITIKPDGTIRGHNRIPTDNPEDIDFLGPLPTIHVNLGKELTYVRK